MSIRYVSREFEHLLRAENARECALLLGKTLGINRLQ